MLYRQMAHAADGLAADGHAVTVEHGAVGHADVLTRRLSARDLMPGFDGDVVIADIQDAFGDAHVFARAGVYGVGVRRIGGRADGDSFDEHVFAVNRHE